MEIKFYATYVKDIKKLKPNFKLIAKNIESELSRLTYEELTNHPKITLMVGNNKAGRFKSGEWRLGFYIETLEDKIYLIFARFLHRKDIYKYFPA